MSSPPNAFASNSIFNKYKGSYFNNDVDVSGGNLICRNGNIYVAPNSYIYSQNNAIQFDETYQYTNFSNNVHVYGYLNVDNSATFGNGLTISAGNTTLPSNSTIASGTNSITFDNTYAFTNFNNSVHIFGTQQIDFGGVTYDVGDLISNVGNMDYNQSYQQHTFTNILTTGMLQIRDALSNDIDLVPKLRDLYSGVIVANNISNTFSSQQNFSNNIRLDGSLIVSNNGLTLTNSNLQKLQYLSNVVSDVNTSLANRVDLASVQTISGTKNFGGTQNFTNMKLDGTLSVQTGTITLTNLEISRLSGVTSNIQTQLTALQSATTNLTYTAGTTLTTKLTSNYFWCSGLGFRFDGALLLNAGALQISNSVCQNIQYLSGLSANVNTSLNGKVSTSGNETIAGIKTFSSPPVMSGASITSNTIPSAAIVGGVVTLSGNNTYTGLQTYNAGVQMSNQFACVDNTNGVQIACYGGRTWDSGTTGDVVNEWIFNNGSQKGFTIQGGGDSSYGEFGMYYIQTTPSFATRQPIMYGKHTGNISGDTLNIASNTLSCKSIAFNGTLNSISTTVLGYISGLSSSAQTQINTANSNIATLQSDVSTANTNISSLQQKLTRCSYNSTDDTTYFFGTLFGQSLTFQNSINGLSTSVFSFLGGITSNVQSQLNSLFSSVSSLNSSVSSINSSLPPVGSVIYTFGNTESSNFLFCNGQAISRSTYNVLFGIIGTTYGAGDGLTSFNLPNVNGLFIRTVGSQSVGGTTYTAQALGVKQQDQVQSHTHSGQAGTYLGNTNQTSTTNSYVSIGGSVKPNTFSFATTGGMNSGLSGTETRPVSVACTALIRVL